MNTVDVFIDGVHGLAEVDEHDGRAGSRDLARGGCEIAQRRRIAARVSGASRTGVSRTYDGQATLSN